MIPVHELLDALGAEADVVAVFLLERGFRGLRGVGEDCPLANYLKASGVAEPAVDSTGVTYEDAGRLIAQELPAAAEDFVMFFDDGVYPQLEARPPADEENL